MAIGSPFLRSLELERHGLEWAYPEVDLAHPFDDGSAAVMLRSVEETARGLGEDGAAWTKLFGSRAKGFDDLFGDDLVRPMAHLPSHPLRLIHFGLPTLAPAATLAKRFSPRRHGRCGAGVAAHAFSPLTGPMSSAVGFALVLGCHTWGWGVARGGSQKIADALAAVIREHGGKIETGARVASLAALPDSDVVVLDLAPAAVVDLAGERMPSRVARAYRRYRRGPGAFKVDLAVEGGVPWANEACAKAGTVHAIGSLDELVAAERDINGGRMPERPLVLVGQQYLADPSRSKGDLHPIWAYAHVPSGWEGAGDRGGENVVLDQIERFAPGLRERIVATATRSPAELQAQNANYVGGDIITGANTPRQITVRPRATLSPYSTGIPGVYICSAATPPGPGAHGMCGFNAARAALHEIA